MERQGKPVSTLCLCKTAFSTVRRLCQACQDHPTAFDWMVTERLTWLPLSRPHPPGWQTAVAQHPGWQQEHHDRLPGLFAAHRGPGLTPGASSDMLTGCSLVRGTLLRSPAESSGISVLLVSSQQSSHWYRGRASPLARILGITLSQLIHIVFFFIVGNVLPFAAIIQRTQLLNQVIYLYVASWYNSWISVNSWQPKQFSSKSTSLEHISHRVSHISSTGFGKTGDFPLVLTVLSALPMALFTPQAAQSLWMLVKCTEMRDGAMGQEVGNQMEGCGNIQQTRQVWENTKL